MPDDHAEGGLSVRNTLLDFMGVRKQFLLPYNLGVYLL